MDIPGIVNLALQKIGTRTTVTQGELINNSTNEAIQANLALAQTRDELLRLAPWQCAKGMIDLQYITSLPGTPENQSTPANQLQWSPGLPLPPYSYEYAYPVDCLRALWVVPQFNPGVVGTPVYPSNNAVGYISTWNGPPIKFDVGNDLFYAVSSAVPVAGGSGHAPGDVIVLAIGPVTSAPIGAPAVVQVTAVGAGGSVQSVNMIATVYGDTVLGTSWSTSYSTSFGGGSSPTSGAYFLNNMGTQAQGSTTGSGTGATFALTFTPQGNQRVILTNQEYAVLSYVRRISDPNVMDSLFVKAWYHVLGANLAMALTGDKALANGLIQITNACIAEARATDGNEALTTNDVTPDWLRCRGVIYSDYWNMGTGYGWDAIGLWPGY